MWVLLVFLLTSTATLDAIPVAGARECKKLAKEMTQMADKDENIKAIAVKCKKLPTA